MAAINLEKFASKKTVSIPGAGDFSVSLLTVGDYIEGKVEKLAKSDGKSGDKAGVEGLISFIVEYSDIPRDVIMKQGIEMIKALSAIIQGGDPLSGNGEKSGNA